MLRARFLHLKYGPDTSGPRIERRTTGFQANVLATTLPCSVQAYITYLLTPQEMGPFKCYIKQLRGDRVSDFPEKSVTQMYGSTLLAL